MIILGIVLIVVGLLVKSLAVLVTIGIILLGSPDITVGQGRCGMRGFWGRGGVCWAHGWSVGSKAPTVIDPGATHARYDLTQPRL